MTVASDTIEYIDKFQYFCRIATVFSTLTDKAGETFIFQYNNIHFAISAIAY